MDVILSWLSVSFSAAAIVLLTILLFLKTSYKRAIKEVEQTVREEFRSTETNQQGLLGIYAKR